MAKKYDGAEWHKEKDKKQAEYRKYREILSDIANDPKEDSLTRIKAIKQIFDFDDWNRELAGYNY